MKRFFLFSTKFFLMFLYTGLFFVHPVAADEYQLLKPELSIDIPTVKFSDAVFDGETISINYLGDYISGIYNWLIGVATLVAIVFLMIGGLQWALFQEGQARKRMNNAVIGLVLLLCTYAILAIVNPQLVLLKPIELEIIEYVPLVKDSGDTAGAVTKDNLGSIGIQCPGSGDVKAIASSFMGKTTYRKGGKGGPPPYSAEDKIDESGKPYKDYCPDGTVCLDCSGFVALVAECAGLGSKNESGGTAGIFASAPVIKSCGSDSVTLDSGTVTLTVGDLVGFKPGDWDKSPKSGHVWMYIGDGTLINSVGGGRATGTAVITQSLKSACKKFPLRFTAR